MREYRSKLQLNRSSGLDWFLRVAQLHLCSAELHRTLNFGFQKT